jgi:hypothetical protein
MSKNIEYIKVDDLDFDFENPRLPIQVKSKSEIIEWMLQDASILELMLAIGQSGFFVGEAILVVPQGRKYIVIEGNRRLTAVKLLNYPELATLHKRKVKEILKETQERPKEIPCLVFEKREEILKYLGYRHVTGVKSWGVLAKAKYLSQLREYYKNKSLHEQSRELAKEIGSKSNYVKRLLIGYEIYEIIEDNGFYKIPRLDKTTFHFNYIADFLNRGNINRFVGVDLDKENPLEEVNEENLETLTRLFFEKNDQNRSRVLGNGDDLKKLNEVLGNKKATKHFLDGESLDDAFKSLEESESSFRNELYEAKNTLQNAQSYVHKIEYDESLIENLKEIVEICKSLKNSLEDKKKDEWDI